MKNSEFNKAISQIKNVTMTSEEKHLVLSRISERIVSASKENVTVSWTTRVWNIFNSTYSRPALAFALVVVFVCTSGSVAFAAEGSLPGDFLYLLKVKVTEPIRDVLAVSDQSRAKWGLRKAERRVREFEALSSDAKVNNVHEGEIISLLDTHIDSLKELVLRLQKNNKSDVADDVRVNFEALMNAHARLIDSTDASTTKSALSRDFAKKVKVKALELDSVNPIKAEKISVVKKGENKKKNKSIAPKAIKLDDTKNDVSLLIKETVDDLKKFNASSSPFNEEVAQNTHKILNDAQKYLDEASKIKGKNRDKELKSFVRSSKITAKEAKIYLDEVVKNNKKKKRGK